MSPKCAPFCNKIVQNGVGFWGFASDPDGRAYDAP